MHIPQNWRPWFYAALVIGAPLLLFAGRPTDDRTVGMRTACVVVWIAACLVYAALAWRTRAASREWRWQDILTVALLAFVAFYEARWRWLDLSVTPDGIAMIWGGSFLGSYWGASLRKRQAAAESGVAGGTGN